MIYVNIEMMISMIDITVSLVITCKRENCLGWKTSSSFSFSGFGETSPVADPGPSLITVAESAPSFLPSSHFDY